jgi:hypothetical protein
MEGKQRGRLMPTRLRIALAAIFGSGALLVVGSLLPWTTWVIDHSTLIVYGLRASGGYTLMIGAVVLAIGVLLLRPSRRVRWSIGPCTCTCSAYLSVPYMSPECHHPLLQVGPSRLASACGSASLRQPSGQSRVSTCGVRS